MPKEPADAASRAVPMTRDELHALVEETLYSYARIRGAVPWDINNLMGAIDEYATLRLNEAVGALQEKAQELSAEAEEEMRRDLEENAQVWHEAAELVRKLKRTPVGGPS